MSRDLVAENYYVTSGGKIPVKWTAPEVSALGKKKYFTCFDDVGYTLQEIFRSE